MTVTCSLCRTALPPERMVFSRHTRRHYCVDFDACDRRVKQQLAAGLETAAVFRCGNCQLDWPEPFCGVCGASLTEATAGAVAGRGGAT